MKMYAYAWLAGWNFHLCSYGLCNVCMGYMCSSTEHFDDLYQYHSQHIHVGQLVVCMSRKHMDCVYWAGTINRCGYSGLLLVIFVDHVHWFETYWIHFFTKFDGFVVLASLIHLNVEKWWFLHLRRWHNQLLYPLRMQSGKKLQAWQGQTGDIAPSTKCYWA